MTKRKHKLRVAVLMGGVSSERNISLSTGRQILESLDPEKYEVVAVDAALIPGSTLDPTSGEDREVEAVQEARNALLKGHKLLSMEEIAQRDAGRRPDVVMIALHGRYGEDGTIQGFMELLGIPYTGSGVLASALAMDKSMTKKVLAACGIRVPPSIDLVCTCFDKLSLEDIDTQVARLGYPVIVKPSRQGSTIGMTKVNHAVELNEAIKQAARYDSLVLVEKFIAGTELTVGVLGNDKPFALPVVEIVPEKGFYDYEAKYTPGATQEIVPARVSDAVAKQAQDIAVAAHRALGCRGMSRVDMISSESGIWVLEVNTIPGMTPTSLLPRAAAAAGIPFAKLLDMLIEYALEKGSDE